MRYRVAWVLLSVAAGGCAVFTTDDNHYSIYFQPYSADLDQQAQETIDAAAAVARNNPALPILIAGYTAPADPSRSIDGLSAQRATMVQQALVKDGVRADRIVRTAKDAADLKGLPPLADRRVDVSIGR